MTCPASVCDTPPTDGAEVSRCSWLDIKACCLQAETSLKTRFIAPETWYKLSGTLLFIALRNSSMKITASTCQGCTFTGYFLWIIRLVETLCCVSWLYFDRLRTSLSTSLISHWFIWHAWPLWWVWATHGLVINIRQLNTISSTSKHSGTVCRGTAIKGKTLCLYSLSGHPRWRWVCFFIRFVEMCLCISVSAMDALQWMGAVRMRVC